MTDKNNHMEQVAQILGKKLYEEFKTSIDKEDTIWRFTPEGLECKELSSLNKNYWYGADSVYLYKLLVGIEVIV